MVCGLQKADPVIPGASPASATVPPCTAGSRKGRAPSSRFQAEGAQLPASRPRLREVTHHPLGFVHSDRTGPRAICLHIPGPKQARRWMKGASGSLQRLLTAVTSPGPRAQASAAPPRCPYSALTFQGLTPACPESLPSPHGSPIPQGLPPPHTHIAPLWVLTPFSAQLNPPPPPGSPVHQPRGSHLALPPETASPEAPSASPAWARLGPPGPA